jgi:chromosome segregation ATPase
LSKATRLSRTAWRQTTNSATDIKFTAAAYGKAYAQFKSDLSNFNAEQDNVNRAFELLKPAFDNYVQRKAQHDANRCTEVQGSGTCNWYNQEADSINAQRDQIVAVKGPLDQRQASLDSQHANLAQTQEKLTEIYNNQVANYDKWKAEQDSIKSTYEDLKARIDNLNKQLAVLYGNLASCLKEIPAACQQPAIGPDGQPVLDQNCEIMKRQCSNMFDGSK